MGHLTPVGAVKNTVCSLWNGTLFSKLTPLVHNSCNCVILNWADKPSNNWILYMFNGDAFHRNLELVPSYFSGFCFLHKQNSWTVASFAGSIPYFKTIRATLQLENIYWCSYWTGFWAARGHLHPRGTGGGPDGKRMLGALLPGAQHRSRWRDPGWCRAAELPRRPIQHFLSYWEHWAPRSESDIRGPGALSGWWAEPKRPDFFPSITGYKGVAADVDDGIQATSQWWSFYLLFNILLTFAEVCCVNSKLHQTITGKNHYSQSVPLRRKEGLLFVNGWLTF